MVTFDAYPYSAGLDAAQEVFGQRSLPVYDLNGSELVVSFQADFLGDYNASSLESSYAAARKPGPNMLRHIQVESNMSLTGANADSRYRLKPSAVNKTLVEVYNAIVGVVLLIRLLLKLLTNLKQKGAKLLFLLTVLKEHRF